MIPLYEAHLNRFFQEPDFFRFLIPPPPPIHGSEHEWAGCNVTLEGEGFNKRIYSDWAGECGFWSKMINFDPSLEASDYA